MKKKEKGPAVPVERHETLRQEIMSVLVQGPASAKDISFEVRISEKEVYDHLEHIRKSLLGRKDSQLVIMPAECVKCGFVFSKRERLKKPGKCPICKGESIREPLFSIQ